MPRETHENFMEQKYKLLEMSEISILLKSYDDIFSDFDPRNYSQRSLSEDFLSEAKRACKDKNNDPIQLRFMVPSVMRHVDKENTIKKRLHDHFRRHHDILRQEKRNVLRKGVVLTIIGIFLLLLATLIKPLAETSFFMRLLFVTIEPTSWFICWYGLDRIMEKTRHGNLEYEFYSKMSNCEIMFFSY